VNGYAFLSLRGVSQRIVLSAQDAPYPSICALGFRSGRADEAFGAPALTLYAFGTLRL
jgi:hypothetical protein